MTEKKNSGKTHALANSSFITALLIFSSFSLFPQVDSSFSLTYDFNARQIKEKNDKLIPKPVGVSLTYDRFGNKESAVYIHGHATSYLNLGTSKLLKPKAGTISIWANLERQIHLGKGYDNNPVLFTKNSDRDDFYDGYVIGYEADIKRFGACITKDSTEEVVSRASEPSKFNEWYHLAITFDNQHFAFYLNGQLQGRFKKNFENIYSETDSVVVGIITSKKNQRYSLGVFDDIQIFHRVLSPSEIKELYEAPNPNQFKNTLNKWLKYGLVILILILIIIALIIRNKLALKKQKEELQMATKISELELKAIKAQMNPHFISNCMAAIQHLIYSSNIEKAGLYVAKFSFFLRQILDYSDEDYINLADEIEMMKLFVEFEQLRFKNGFKFDLQIQTSINPKEILIPALITQPFIENAIWHGLLPLKQVRAPQLKINVLIENNLPIIEVEDNGVGRDLTKKNKSKNKGTKLVLDKIDILNRLSKTSNYKIEIIDLTDVNGQKNGTKIAIRLDNIKE